MDNGVGAQGFLTSTIDATTSFGSTDVRSRFPLHRRGPPSEPADHRPDRRGRGLDARLRLAPRRSEHVDCAAGQHVLAAGEVLFARDGGGWCVSEISNQSTGYCPDPDSWPAVAMALDRIGPAHPGDFTHKVIFRRCPACGQLNIVRDGHFACAVCDGDLPAHWNISTA